MEYAIGFIAGILVAILIGAVAAYFFLRDKTPADSAALALPPSTDLPTALTTVIAEPFINQQLTQILVGDSANGAGSKLSAPQVLGPFKLKLNGARLNFLPDRHATL